MYNTKTGSTSITGTVEVKLTFERVNRRSRRQVPAPITEKVDLEAVKVWFVGVGKLQFKKSVETPSDLPTETPTETEWQDFQDTNNTIGQIFFKEVKLDFKVTKEPKEAPSWPSNFPQWSINNPGANLEGSDECSGVEFYLEADYEGNLEADDESYLVVDDEGNCTYKKRTVTVKCGASAVSGEIEVFLYKIYLTSLQDGKEDSPFPSYASFVIKRDRGIGTLSVSFSVVQDATKLDSKNKKRLAIEGTDFTIAAKTIEFVEDETEKTVEVSITDDVYFEGDEYFGIQLNEDKENYSLTAEEKDATAEEEDTTVEGEDTTVAAEEENTIVGFGILKITDNDKLELKKIVFEGIEDLKPDPVPATTPPAPPAPTYSWSAGPHWEKGKEKDKVTGKDTDKDKSLNLDPALGYVPVAYSGGTKIKVKATFDGQIDKNPSLDVYSYFEASIAGSDYSSNKSEESTMVKLENGTTTDTLSTVTATYTATAELAKKVAYESSLKTKFTYQTKDAVNKLTEEATSCMYVTLDKPKTGTELYHTVVHIGCSAAHGESDETEVFKKIWSKFEGNNICINKVKIDGGAVDDDPSGKLFYYGIGTTVPSGTVWNPRPVPSGTTANSYSIARKEETATTKDILVHRDGRCGTWQSFFLSILRAHKINVVAANIYVNVFRKVEILSVKENEGQHHSIKPRERSWQDHAIIYFRSNSSYYDTSYGKSYGSDKIEAARKFVTESVGSFYGLHSTPGPPVVRVTGWYSSVRPNRVLFEYNDDDDGDD